MPPIDLEMPTPDLGAMAEAWYIRACYACQIPWPISDTSTDGNILPSNSQAGETTSRSITYRHSTTELVTVALDETEFVFDEDYTRETPVVAPNTGLRRSPRVSNYNGMNGIQQRRQQLPPYTPGTPPPAYDTEAVSNPLPSSNHSRNVPNGFSLLPQPQPLSKQGLVNREREAIAQISNEYPILDNDAADRRLIELLEDTERRRRFHEIMSPLHRSQSRRNYRPLFAIYQPVILYESMSEIHAPTQSILINSPGKGPWYPHPRPSNQADKINLAIYARYDLVSRGCWIAVRRIWVTFDPERCVHDVVWKKLEDFEAEEADQEMDKMRIGRENFIPLHEFFDKGKVDEFAVMMAWLKKYI